MKKATVTLKSQNRSLGDDFDLVVVGGGIVGCALALAAARASVALCDAHGKGTSQGSAKPQAISIALIDASEQRPKDVAEVDDDRKTLTRYDPRVVALSHESRDFLQQLDVWSSIKNHGLCSYQSMEVWDAEGTGNIRFNAEDLRRDSLGCIVENRAVLASLYDKLAQQVNVKILRGVRVNDLIFPEDSSCKSDGEWRTEIITDKNQSIAGRLIVAADGAKSKLRDIAGIDTRQWSYSQSAIVCTVKTEQKHEHTAWQRFTQHGPLAFLPLCTRSDKSAIAGAADGETYSSIVWSLDTQIAEEKLLLDEEAFCADLSQAFENRLGKVQMASERYSFPLVQCHAKKYFKSNVVVIGDAAHSIHPLAGQGVNLGLADAKVLAREIVRAGERDFSISHSSVAKRYQRQRQSHNLAAMSAMEFFKRLYGAENLILRYLRNRGMEFCNKQSELKKILATLAVGHSDN